MLSRSATASLLLCCLPFLTSFAAAAVETQCYVLDGTPKGGAGFRCDNSTTGHSACCAAGATCYSNGLCKQDNGNVVDYLRVGCTDPFWQAPACLDRCVKFANSSTAGVRFCNGDVTQTTDYCCDDGSTGVGSFACCKNSTNIFQIKPKASILAQMPLTQLSTTSSASSTSTSTTSSTSNTSPAAVTTSAAATTTAASSSGSSNGAAIGAGVGVPVALIALAGLGFFFWRRRRNAKTQAFELSNNQPDYSTNAPGNYNGYHDAQSPPVSEAPGQAYASKNKTGYFGDQGYTPAPQELSAHQVHELSSGRD